MRWMTKMIPLYCAVFNTSTSPSRRLLALAKTPPFRLRNSSFCFSVSCCSFNALFEDFFDTLSAANPALTSIRLANSANRTMLACMLFKVDLQFYLQFLSPAAALSLILVFLASFASRVSFFRRSAPPGSTIFARIISAYSFFFVTVHLWVLLLFLLSSQTLSLITTVTCFIERALRRRIDFKSACCASLSFCST